MLAKLLNSLRTPRLKTITIFVRRGRQQTPIECRVGDNLMDVTNSTVNQDANIFGLCDKQLACTTCRVDIESLYQRLPVPSQQQLDVLLTTKNYNESTSRMACQVVVTEEMDGMAVRINAGDSMQK